MCRWNGSCGRLGCRGCVLGFLLCIYLAYQIVFSRKGGDGADYPPPICRAVCLWRMSRHGRRKGVCGVSLTLCAHGLLQVFHISYGSAITINPCMVLMVGDMSFENDSNAIASAKPCCPPQLSGEHLLYVYVAAMSEFYLLHTKRILAVCNPWL